MTYLDPVKKLVEEATEGEWFADPDDENESWTVWKGPPPARSVALDIFHEPDARFIAASRSLLPLLLDVAEAGEMMNGCEKVYEDKPRPYCLTHHEDVPCCGDDLRQALDSLRQHLQEEGK